VAALVAATAISLYAISFDVAATRRALRFDPRALIGIGVLIAMGCGILSLLAGGPFLTGIWGEVQFPGFPELFVGTPLLFDLGVFIAVLGVVLTMVLALMEE